MCKLLYNLLFAMVVLILAITLNFSSDPARGQESCASLCRGYSASHTMDLYDYGACVSREQTLKHGEPGHIAKLKEILINGYKRAKASGQQRLVFDSGLAYSIPWAECVFKKYGITRAGLETKTSTSSRVENKTNRPAPFTPEVADRSIVGKTCAVSDPSGTPLNIRSSPNGLKTGATLAVDGAASVTGVTTDSQGRTWAKVNGGYVFAKSIDCSDAGVLLARARSEPKSVDGVAPIDSSGSEGLEQGAPDQSEDAAGNAVSREAIGDGKLPNCIALSRMNGLAWQVTNNCSVRVIGKFCYMDTRKILSCEQNQWGEFGPISPGKIETITPPTKDSSGQYKVTGCEYEAWKKNACRMH